jgi:hypothetical protein
LSWMLDLENTDNARWKTATKPPVLSDRGLVRHLSSVNLSRNAAYQPPDFCRAAALPLYGSPKVSPPPGEFGP